MDVNEEEIPEGCIRDEYAEYMSFVTGFESILVRMRGEILDIYVAPEDRPALLVKAASLGMTPEEYLGDAFRQARDVIGDEIDIGFGYE